VVEAPECLSERPYHVEVLGRERPRDGDRLQHLRRKVSLPSVELAPFTASHNDHYGPVETLLESFFDKGSRPGMVTTGTYVYLLQQLVALISGNTPHEYVGGPRL
jgi:hypothetical protein